MQKVNRRGQVLKNLDTVADHTKDVVKKLLDLTTHMPSFKRHYGLTGAVPSPIHDGETQYLILVAFVHDVYKLLDGRNHAGRGADFLSKPETANLVQYHDVLGVVDTGEASVLFLGDLVRALGKSESPSDFLRRLLVVTMVDVAAAGFLTQERLESYRYLLNLVRKASRSKLSQLATNETAERIGRLLQSNDRIKVKETKEVEKAIRRHQDPDKLRAALASARFHYGAWALEPCLWRWLGQPDPTPKDEHKRKKIVVNARHAPILDSFLSRLWRIVNCTDSPLITKTGERIGGQNLNIYNLERLSVKFGDNKRFTRWCATAPHKGTSHTTGPKGRNLIR